MFADPAASLPERRDQMLDAAAHVFAERGFRQTDVQAIADRVGVGKGTVYRHFKSKEGLFLAAVDWGMQQLQRGVLEAADTSLDPLEQVRAGIRAYLRFFDRHPQIVELLILERAEFPKREKATYFAYRDANQARWSSLWEALIDAGRVRDVPVRRIMDVINDLLYGAIFTNAIARRDTSFETQAEDILDALFHGFVQEDRS